jgi:anthranilate synthase component 1
MKIFTREEEILSDTFTPISSYLNLRDSFANVSLFESSDYSNKENSKSFIGIEPIITIQIKKRVLELRRMGELIQKEVITSASELGGVMAEIEFNNEEVAVFNGFFGVIGYEAIPLFESINFDEKISGDLPEIYFAVYKYVLVFDHFKNHVKLLFNSFDSQKNDLPKLKSKLLLGNFSNGEFNVNGPFKTNETDDSFKRKIAKVKDHIAKGDVFQLVLSRKFQQDFYGDDFEVYRQLRTLNPSPYMFYFDLEKAKLLGASPEAQIKIANGIAEIHPIAGTVRRSENEQDNIDRIAELIQDEKENAEHTMLVDLARNDLNQNCLDVEVTNLKEVQSFSHVIHMVSRVIGKVENSKSLKVFGGSFPAGTLSGAPKFKAMELIDELENSGRGYYGGAIGQIAANGDLNMAIVIRSALSLNGQLIYQAGAGIVQNSSEESENQEVYNKVGAIQQAITNANDKL